MRVALVQLNPVVGDLARNASRIVDATRQATARGADLVVTSELSLMGYPPRDLLLDPDFVRRTDLALETVAADLADCPPVLVGLAARNTTGQGRPLVNVAALLRGGRVEQTFRKTLLPTYDVFDEDRYFEPGRGVEAFECRGKRVAVSICEDVWNDQDFWGHQRYALDPTDNVAALGADLLVNLSASPFTAGKQRIRERMLGAIARKIGIPLVYVNQVGGNDDIVFDGRSVAFHADGRLGARAAAFAEDVLVVDLERFWGGSTAPDTITPDPADEEETWMALVLGLRDYARKCGFRHAVLGLSGGVDSALVAAIAAEALGPGNVHGILMPSPFSSTGSVDDSLDLARRLGIRTSILPIGPIMDVFDAALSDPFAGRARDVTEENVQARIRGNLLMALANKTGALLLTTGNKSELAVGYCTLYGDMCGGLAVISDVPKTLVYRLSRWRNGRGPVIPEAILTKAPSAELRPNQTDQDSLPPYDELDEILRRHIENRESGATIVAAGFDPATVGRVLHLVQRAEFKRRQAAPGLKITDRAFGVGWRMPIACAVSETLQAERVAPHGTVARPPREPASPGRRTVPDPQQPRMSQHEV
jgi:NAD+ synthase/NAD+ synthase (glutamine-hydrolysing)